MFAYRSGDRSCVVDGKNRRVLRVAPGATLVLTGLLAACAPPLAKVAGPDPADPHAAVRPVGYKPVIGSYTSQRPVDPTSWRDQNDRAAPAPKP
jgi:hypothetical protein